MWRFSILTLFGRGGTLQTAYRRRYFGGCGPPGMYLLVLGDFASNPYAGRLRFGVVSKNRRD
ncbi:cobalamin biosynthesis protein [Neisseria meningitidis]|nr:cobalamin biosynthesis protein [Neisseria meningitidis]